MSVTNPGVSSSAPPKTTSTPSIASRAGTRPSEIARLKRVHARLPSERMSIAPSTESTTRSAMVGQDADRLAHLQDHVQLQQRDDDEEEQEDRDHLASQPTAGKRLCQDGERLDEHAVEAVQADALDQRTDLGLGAAYSELRTRGAQAPREHRDVEHERRVGERELRQVDGDVGAADERAREGATATRLRRSHLVAAAAQHGWAVVERDDGEQATRWTGP